MNDLRIKKPAKGKVLKNCTIDGKPAKAGDTVTTCEDTVRNLTRKGILSPA